MTIVHYCEDCGSRVFNGACVNCHEEIYIERQYVSAGDDVPQVIEAKADAQRAYIHAKRLERQER